jgi:recombination protein RecA
MDKQRLRAAFSQIEKQHGPGTVFRLGGSRRLNVEVIPTDVLDIDKATGVGGIPRGRITEIFGPNSGGKTTLTLQLIAKAQAMGGAAAFIDAEHALDPTYAKALGVDVDNLIVSQPDNGEQALEVAQTLIESEQFAIVVVDSVAALVPKKELEGEMGDSQMGSQARLMSQAMRKLNGAVARTKTSLIFINQIRMKIGTMYGNPETTTGGEALKFFSSLRISIRPGQGVKQGDKQTGATTKIKIVKNKLASPFKEAEVEMVYGAGFEALANNLKPFVDAGVLTKNGSRFVYKGNEVANGKEAAIQEFRDNALLYQQVYEDARVALFAPKAPALPASQPEGETEQAEELPSLADLEAELDEKV